MTATTTRALTRPLKELVPSIRGHINDGKKAAQEASAAHYVLAGVDMHHAKPQVQGAWSKWLKDKFGIAESTARTWMALAKTECPNLLPYKDNGDDRSRSQRKPLTAQGLRDLHGRLEGQSKADLNEKHGRRRHGGGAWVEEARRVLNGVDSNRYRKEMIENEGKELKLRQELARKLIDIGYKALAMKFHPDQNQGRGTPEMARLNGVRKMLLEAVR